MPRGLMARHCGVRPTAARCAGPRARRLAATPPLVALTLATLLGACGADPDPCARVDCGEQGRCVVASGVPRCDCSTGFHAVGSRCELQTDAGAPGCGNGTRDGSELCDGEDLGGETCASRGVQGGGLLGCAADCLRFDLSRCAATCGDGVAAGGEACDGQDLRGATCGSEGYYPGFLVCSASCTFDPSACSGRCGDGVIQGIHGESCDGTNLGGATCEDVGFYLGSLACDSGCGFDTSGCAEHCGDGVIQVEHGEVCDGTALGSASCLGLGYLGGTLGCQPGCRALDVSQCETNCGDGVLDFGEVCDDGNQLGGDGCSADCREAPGRVVYVSNASGSYEVWTMLDDGTNAVQITSDALNSSRCAGAHLPRFSRDGALIAFRYGGDALACSGMDSAIHVVTLDGTPIGPSPIVTGPMGGGFAFTRDATAIVYTAGTDRTLRIVRLDGSGDAPFFDAVDQERDPDAHPSLDRWVFASFRAGGEFPGLFVLEGGGASGLVGACTACDQIGPRFSANGDRVLFHRDQSAFMVTADGAVESLILSTRVDFVAAWAGETRIVFEDGNVPADPNISLVQIDGSGLVVLTTHTGYDGQPDWHPGPRDLDLDGVLDWEDNCPATPNPLQEDDDGDGVGNACQP